MRFSWFVVGSLFGAALVYAVLSTVHYAELSKQIKGTQSYAMLQSALTTAPAKAPEPATSANAEPAKAQLVLPATLNLSVTRGDTLTSILLEKGVTHDEAYHVVESLKKVYNPKRLNIGQALELNLDKSKSDSSKPAISGLSIVVSPLKTVKLARASDDSFTAREIKAQVFKGYGHAGGTIRSSLYETGINSGVPPQLLSEVINAFSYDVDFQRDIKEGDELDVMYERMHTAEDITAGHGHVLYASLTLGDRQLTIYRHASPDGFAGYYNTKGESVKKALLKTPINGAHITSRFGMRMHPLLGYSRMHKGVDFGAATGTPIYAAGDGIIEFAGRKAGYGNFVVVKHSKMYETAYGHASRFARGIHPGVHVKQGQVIAYVGMTGAATGPHLHYEIRVSGNQVNPAGVKFRTGQTLGGREFAQFKREVQQIQTALATIPRKTQVASLAQ